MWLICLYAKLRNHRHPSSNNKNIQRRWNDGDDGAPASNVANVAMVTAFTLTMGKDNWCGGVCAVDIYGRSLHFKWIKQYRMLRFNNEHVWGRSSVC